MEDVKKIVIVSDGTGKTAKRLLDAVLAQYSEKEVEYSLEGIYQEVRTRKRLDEVLSKIDDDSLVIFSLISQDLSGYMHQVLEERDVLHLNALEPMLSIMSKFLGVHPDYKPGLLQIIDDRYYRRIDAISYTVEHDDGQGHLIEEADVVLLGLSRTCKTPISMYLACNYGMKAANIPIVPNDAVVNQVKARISLIPRRSVFGLIMHPDVLLHVREERRVFLNGNALIRSDLETYCDPEVIHEEVKFSRRFFTELDIETINVTRRAIEEISKEVMDKLDGGD
jgi:hypothetical protein